MKVKEVKTTVRWHVAHISTKICQYLVSNFSLVAHTYTCDSLSALVSINEVNRRRARLVLGWVTVSGFNFRCGTFILVCNQPSRSTQPGHPFVGRHNEYQPNGGDALRLGSKARYDSYVGGRLNCVIPLLHSTRAISERFRDRAL